MSTSYFNPDRFPYIIGNRLADFAGAVSVGNLNNQNAGIFLLIFDKDFVKAFAKHGRYKYNPDIALFNGFLENLDKLIALVNDSALYSGKTHTHSGIGIVAYKKNTQINDLLHPKYS